MTFKTNSILLIRAGDASRMASGRQFDRHGIIRNQDYLLFPCDNIEEFMSEISAEQEPQLIFTSHLEFGVFDSVKLARRIKEINQNAIVFALTSSEVWRGNPDKLDGVIENKFESAGTPHLVAEAFLSGQSRQQLIKIALG